MAFKQISNNFSIAGQIAPDELKRAASEGFKSIINLRSPQEEGFIPSQQQQAESVGLKYANIPVKPSEINGALVTEILSKIDDLHKYRAKPTRFNRGAIRLVKPRNRGKLASVE